jgi:hypothetical protein
MSGPIGSGMGEDQYRRHKNARDKLERSLIDHGTKPDVAKKIADRTAHETDNKRRQEGK